MPRSLENLLPLSQEEIAALARMTASFGIDPATFAKWLEEGPTAFAKRFETVPMAVAIVSDMRHTMTFTKLPKLLQAIIVLGLFAFGWWVMGNGCEPFCYR